MWVEREQSGKRSRAGLKSTWAVRSRAWVVVPEFRGVWASDISVTETITETEIIDPALTETETMLIYEMEIL